MTDFSAVMLLISEGLRIATTVANLSCSGGPYEPFKVTAQAAVSLLLSASVIFRYSDLPQHGRVMWIAMRVLAIVQNTVFLFAVLVGSFLMWSRDWPVSTVLAGVLLALLFLALTPPVRRNIRSSIARRGIQSALALMAAHVLVAGSILTASSMLALELSGGPAAMDRRTGCAMEVSIARSVVYFSGRNPASISALRGSMNGGSDRLSPSVSSSSSMAKPGPSVASSNRMPLGSRT